MYQDFSRWAKSIGTPGWPTDSTTRRSRRSGTESANAQATAAPKSWPTTCVFSIPSSSRIASDVTDALADAVGVDVVRLVGVAEPAQVRAR